MSNKLLFLGICNRKNIVKIQTAAAETNKIALNKMKMITMKMCPLKRASIVNND